jgi:ATP-dependent helicase Lhr and Lhr-like helicase
MQQALPLVKAKLTNQGPMAGLFHPAVAEWFTTTFGCPTQVQERAWAVTARHRNALITAPTGSGKTLAAFLAAINDLVVEGIEHGLKDEVHVVYISPLKALSNDIQKNLQAPLRGICDRVREMGLARLDIRDAVRTGDTPVSERTRMRRQPPHILVTTPESLFILMSSDSGREMLKSTRSVIVDELHAVAGTKRGAHLALTLERLEALCEKPPLRIGLSATQKPIESMARLLMGVRADECEIVDTGHTRHRDLALEVPKSPLTSVMAAEVWSETYDRLAEFTQEHRTTLIFVNQRRQAERIARHLAERIGEEHVTSHHGSLAKEHRLKAEQRLKAGQLKALVATSSLELGIDIGDVDLVCQIGSPRSINAFLQRVGRSGHAVRATPKGRLFPASLDDLAESVALLDCIKNQELDRIAIFPKPMDVLAQQIVSEASCQEWTVDALHARFSRALPYRDLKLEEFEEIVQMLADGYSTRRGRRGALLHYDAVNRRIRGRRGAKLTVVTNAGTIPDQFDYEVELLPEGLRIGTLNEDFAFESLPGDVVQLGNTSYRVLKVETGKVYVQDAKGEPPSMPFWFGEAPGRTDELSIAVSRLRARADEMLQQGGIEACTEWFKNEYGLAGPAAVQLAAYYDAARLALGVLPTRDKIVFERFFDDVGDTHFVIHAPLGSRIMRAWGLALRKKFCRQFNFELQAAALDDSLILSLGPTHSFPMEEVKHYLKSATAEETLTQAVLQAPMFATRWRWAASIALAVARNRSGKRVPPQWQRSDAEDLLVHAFPDALACQDNLPGDREMPDHPLVQQAMWDCLHDVMDVDGMIALVKRLETGATEVICRELVAPSPLSESILSAKPYAFLDDGAKEERRTHNVTSRGVYEPESAKDLGKLDPAVIEQVRLDMKPIASSADELHDALVVNGFLTGDEAEAAGKAEWLDELFTARRVARIGELWVAAERLHEMRALFPQAVVEGNAPTLRDIPDAGDALKEIIRSRLESHGPVTAEELGAPLGLSAAAMQTPLVGLEAEGYVMRGNFTGSNPEEWCERRRLARIHRYTRERRRAEFQPVPPAAFMRFLFDWQGISGQDRREGPAALEAVLQQLEGYPVAASAWESDVLEARMHEYDPQWLDQLCASGRWVWQRPASQNGDKKASPVRATPTLLLPREQTKYWNTTPDVDPELSGAAQVVLEVLREHGASFFSDLVADTDQLRTHVEAALGELVSHGLITSDGFNGLRALTAPADLKARRLRRSGIQGAFADLESAGRWSLMRTRRLGNKSGEKVDESEQVEYIARALLRRYGVVFRKLIEREPHLPPWREIFYVMRRLEARGEIRGGRFVTGFAGEQFALNEAAGSLRRYREEPAEDVLVVIAGSDPLNLTGSITAGERVASISGNRILFRNGIPVALRLAGEVKYLADVDPATQNGWKDKLIRT